VSEGSKIEVVHRFFSGTGTSYDSMVRVGTLGFDRRWKNRIMEKIPRNPTRIMDQACGTGILTFKIAQSFPHCRVVGVELRDEYLDLARARARSLKISHVEFFLGRAEDVFVNESFDCVTSSYLAKYAELGPLLRNIRGMLRRGGVLVMHDFSYPSNRAFAAVWELYFRLLRRIGNWKYPQWKTVFDELPEFLRKTTWVRDLTASLQENGFSDIRLEYLTFGAAAIVTAKKAGIVEWWNIERME
jgi:demethylmenaquinone methyltransferase / 2-methoxy-6-polyprenyl-1,4-benzoquinol methylase